MKKNQERDKTILDLEELGEFVKIKEVKVSSLLKKRENQFYQIAIDPYIGCTHKCLYCFADYTKYETNHINEEWGTFCDVKTNCEKLIKKDIKSFNLKQPMVIGTLTDPYQAVEKHYKKTRHVLRELLPFKDFISFNLTTKSKLIVRDVDLIKQFTVSGVSISLGIDDPRIARILEPFASSVEDRIETLKIMKSNGIYVTLNVMPLMPGISNFKKLIKKTKDYVDFYIFDKLSLFSSIKKNIFSFLKTNKPELVSKYKEIYGKDGGKLWWKKKKNEIIEYCNQNNIKHGFFDYPEEEVF